MHKRISQPLAFFTLVGVNAAMASAVMADTNDEGQWVTTFTGGINVLSHSTLLRRADGGLASLSDLNSASVDAPASTRLRRLTMHDAFRLEPGLDLELGYMANSNVEPFMKLEYSQLRGRNERIGELTSPAPSSPATITSKFDDMHSWNLDFGSRYFWTDYGAVTPYVAGFMGVDRTQAMRAHLIVNGLADLDKAQLLPQQTRFEAGVESGVSFRVADQTDLRLSVGANYVDARKRNSEAFAPLGVDSVSLTEQRWSVPVDLGLNYRF